MAGSNNSRQTFVADILAIAKLLVLRVGGVFCIYLMHMLLSRSMSVEAYGSLMYAWSVAAVLAMISTLGFPALSNRLIPEYITKKNPRKLMGFILFAITVFILLSALIVCFILYLGDYSEEKEVFFLAASLLPFAGMLLLLNWFLISFGQVKQSLIADNIIFPLFVIIVVLFFAHDFYGDILVYGLALASVYVVFVTTQQVLKEVQNYTDTAITPSQWLKASIPLLISGLLIQLQMRLDLLMVGAMRDMGEAGLYSVVSRVSLVVGIAPTIIVAAYTSKLSASIHQENSVLSTRLFRFGSVLSVVLSLLVAVILYVWSDFFLGLFGREYIVASDALNWLIMGQIMLSLSGLSSVIFIAMNQQNRYTFYVFIFGVLNLVLNWVLIPTHGYTGAAIATTIANIMLYGILFIVINYELKKVGR